MKTRFDSVPMTAYEALVSMTCKDSACCLADDIESMIVDSREKSLALTKLEECVMWLNKAIAYNGVKNLEEEDVSEESN